MPSSCDVTGSGRAAEPVAKAVLGVCAVLVIGVMFAACSWAVPALASAAAAVSVLRRGHTTAHDGHPARLSFLLAFASTSVVVRLLMHHHHAIGPIGINVNVAFASLFLSSLVSGIYLALSEDGRTDDEKTSSTQGV